MRLRLQKLCILLVVLGAIGVFSASAEEATGDVCSGTVGKYIYSLAGLSSATGATISAPATSLATPIIIAPASRCFGVSLCLTLSMVSVKRITGPVFFFFFFFGVQMDINGPSSPCAHRTLSLFVQGNIPVCSLRRCSVCRHGDTEPLAG